MATEPGYILVGAGAYSTTAATTGDATFVDLGGFREDLRMRFSEERFNLEVADHLAFVKSVRTRLDCFLQTSLVEARMEVLAVGLGTNPASTLASSMELAISDPTSNYQNIPHAHRFVGSDATAPASAEITTWTFSQAIPQVDMELSYRKDGELLIPTTFLVLGTIVGANMGFGVVDKGA